MSIIDLVKINKSLLYLDAETGEQITFGELLIEDSVLKLPKKLVFLYLDNSLQSISAFWNFVQSEHAIALLSPQVKDEYKYRLEELYKPYFIYDPSRKIIADYQVISFLRGAPLFITKLNQDFPIHKAIKILLSTSGTTGSPKFVKLSEENLLQNALSIVDYLPIKGIDVVPLNLPVFYSYGLSVLTSNSISGGKIVCTNKDVLMKEFWHDVDSFQYTSLSGVPFVYEMLNRIGFVKKKNPTFRYLTQAGGKLNEKTLKIFADYCKTENILFYVMYGQTEATARMSYLHPDYLHQKLGSIGKPIKNGTFFIDADTSELCYKGPNVFGGYADNLQDLEIYKDEKLLHTGDIGKVDQEGFYYITGRLKRFVKIFGTRINLDEIETLLKNKFEDITFVSVGLDDKKLFIGFTSKALEDKAISDFIVSELKLHPSTIVAKYMEEIPLTANGKPNYSQIYERYKH